VATAKHFSRKRTGGLARKASRPGRRTGPIGAALSKTVPFCSRRAVQTKTPDRRPSPIGAEVGPRRAALSKTWSQPKRSVGGAIIVKNALYPCVHTVVQDRGELKAFPARVFKVPTYEIGGSCVTTQGGFFPPAREGPAFLSYTPPLGTVCACNVQSWLEFIFPFGFRERCCAAL